MESGVLKMSNKRPFWRRWIVDPIVQQLTNGITPDRLSWTIAWGAVLGIFPIMGSTSLLCFAVGWVMKFNQPVLHIFKTLVYPLHLALILVFIHMGQRLLGVPELSFSIPQLLEKFQNDPMQFAKDFGMAAVHGVVAWAIVAPILVFIFRIVSLLVLRKMQHALNSVREVAA